ncbi:hypothetical protein ACS60F_11020, partial [Streptococcus suis]
SCQHLSAVVDWQICSCFALQIWPLRLMRTEFASFPTSNSHYSDCWSYAGVGVKQSGNRLFQLNNWK